MASNLLIESSMKAGPMTASDRENSGNRARPPPATLGDVLNAGELEEPLNERDWVVLVNYVAAGDQRALRQLYERTHRPVFSLIARITNSRDIAEDLTVEVFRDVWRQAPGYRAADTPVLGWIMGLARAKALDWAARDRELNGDLLSPTSFLWGQIARRIVSEYGLVPVFTAPNDWTEPDWKEVSPGIFCQILAADEQRDRVSMLVRLDPGVDYPPHTHAGVEELHLLHGELWIDDRKLYPGDYNRAEPGTCDSRVWTETGCTCVLITSPSDELKPPTQQ
jgi:DNA-directed RNA polymerase specialized sigma24 family protein